MSFIGNIMKNMRVNQDDDYDYDDDYEFDGDDEDYEPQRNRFFKKSVDDDMEDGAVAKFLKSNSHSIGSPL